MDGEDAEGVLTHPAELKFRLREHSRLGLGEPRMGLAWTAAAHCSENLWSQPEALSCCSGPWDQLQAGKEVDCAGVWEMPACCKVVD